MKYYRLFVLAAVVGAIFAAPLVAHASILDPDRLDAIQEHCSVLQTTLDQLQRRDLVSRTDRGRDYENVIKQLDAFSQRLHNNNMPTQDVDGLLGEFRSMISDFRGAYLSYDDSMNSLRQIDCTTHAADFAQALEQTRVLRAETGLQVTRSEDILARYRDIVVQLQASVPAATKAGQ